MITGSVSNYVKANADCKGVADKFGASEKNGASFSQKRGDDIPSWLQQMKQQEKSSRDTLKLSRITSKLDSGSDLTEKELSYLRRTNPMLYNRASAAKQEKNLMKYRLSRCKSRAEVKSLGLQNAVQAASGARACGSSDGGAWSFAAANREYSKFFSSKEYAKLSDKKSAPRKRLNTKA